MKRWLVTRHAFGGGTDVLEADLWDVLAGGVLRLYRGSIFEPVLVRAYGPAAWLSIEPAPGDLPTPTEET